MVMDRSRHFIPNGCFDAYEVKVNKDISKYQEKVKHNLSIPDIYFNLLHSNKIIVKIL